MRAPEFLRKQIANRGGWFWLPCPVCGQMFGGFETGGTLWTSVSSGKLTCSDCTGNYVYEGVEIYKPAIVIKNPGTPETRQSALAEHLEQIIKAHQRTAPHDFPRRCTCGETLYKPSDGGADRHLAEKIAAALESERFNES